MLEQLDYLKTQPYGLGNESFTIEAWFSLENWYYSQALGWFTPTGIDNILHLCHTGKLKRNTPNTDDIGFYELLDFTISYNR